MATHSSILAWRIPLTEEPDRLQSMGSQEFDMTSGVNSNSNSKDKEQVCSRGGVGAKFF